MARYLETQDTKRYSSSELLSAHYLDTVSWERGLFFLDEREQDPALVLKAAPAAMAPRSPAEGGLGSVRVQRAARVLEPSSGVFFKREKDLGPKR